MYAQVKNLPWRNILSGDRQRGAVLRAVRASTASTTSTA